MKTLIKLAWRNIWRNKRRTFITMASIFFAVILSTLIVSVKDGVQSNMIKNSVGDFLGYIQIQQTDYKEDMTVDNSLLLSDSLRSILTNNSNIVTYLPRIESFALAAADENTKGTMVVGADVSKENQFNNLAERIIDGEYLNNDDKAVLVGSGLAKYLNLSVGDTIVLMGKGYHSATAAGKYQVKGILKFGSPELSNRLVFLPIKEAQWLFDLESRYTSLNLQLKDVTLYNQTTTELNQVLNTDYTAYSWEALLPQLKNIIETDKKEGYMFMFILYMVVSFGIFGTTLMMLAERRHEFGVLISIGMKKIKLAISVWIEIISLTFLGALFGMLAAFPICLYFNINPIPLGESLRKLTEEYGIEAVLQFSIRPGIFTTQAVVVFVLASVISVYSFIKLLRYNPIKEMKS
ncbi:MAG: putative ABC transport system permease protein [Planctomycetota bacterium]|jgi:putative ABC transport system permease protein